MIIFCEKFLNIYLNFFKLSFYQCSRGLTRVVCRALVRYGHVLEGLPGVNNHSGAYCTYRTITTIAGWFQGGGEGSHIIDEVSMVEVVTYSESQLKKWFGNPRTQHQFGFKCIKTTYSLCYSLSLLFASRRQDTMQKNFKGRAEYNAFPIATTLIWNFKEFLRNKLRFT